MMDSSYPWPSSLNVANFVTVKPCLDGDERSSSFKIWKKQMLCLLESQDLLGFVDGGIIPPPDTHQQKLWRRTDSLIQGWILGSIGNDALHAVWEKQTARDVWLELDSIFNDQQGEEEIAGRGGDFSWYLEVYQAAQRGDWYAVLNFFSDINELSTTIISSYSETALHVAVKTGWKAIDLVKKLVELMPSEALALKQSHGDTALHYAAKVGNTEAAMALVDKNPNLLYALNDEDRSAIIEAAMYCQKETLQYLISISSKAECHPFQGQQGIHLLNSIIASEFLDIALDLAVKHPNLALLIHQDGDSALSTIAQMDILFPRTECFTWFQNLIYHRIPLKWSKCEAAHTSDTADIENLTRVTAPQRNYIIPRVLQKVESMIWNGIESLGMAEIAISHACVGDQCLNWYKYGFVLLVPKVKELKEKKATHQQALLLAEYLCKKIVSSPGKETSTIFETSIINATKYGISEIVEMIMNTYPMATFHKDPETGRNVFLLAASYRFENVTNLFYNMSDHKYMLYDNTDDNDNNLMHICAKLAPPNRLGLVSGAALQMQRELQWFKEMKKFVNPSRRSVVNKEKQTPEMIFTKEHKKLKAEGERWMKDTANACSITAALIVTIMFAAAFTIPGGIDTATHTPLYKDLIALDVFAHADAASLFSSIFSLLMFLSILTSRYAEEDFLYVLPTRLTLGLVSLFVSITCMMAAFCITIFLFFRKDGSSWFIFPLSGFACLPVASFLLLQLPLLVEMLSSTYGPGIFGNKTHRFIC